MRLAIVLVFIATACKSAERTPEVRAETLEVRADTPPGERLAEMPLEEVIALPPEATPEMIEARLDRAFELVDAMFETLVEHKDDCEKVAVSLERFVEVNRKMIAQLKELEGHQELMQTRFKPKIDAWIEKWMPKLVDASSCFSNPRVMAVFEKLSKQQ